MWLNSRWWGHITGAPLPRIGELPQQSMKWKRRSQRKSQSAAERGRVVEGLELKDQVCRLTRSLQEGALLTDTLLWLPTATATTTQSNQPFQMVSIYSSYNDRLPGCRAQSTQTFCHWIRSLVQSMSCSCGLFHTIEWMLLLVPSQRFFECWKSTYKLMFI